MLLKKMMLVLRKQNILLNLIACAAFAGLCQISAQAESSVAVSWNPSESTNAVGYKIYYGTASRSYTNSMMVGNVTQAVVSGLAPGATYYFSATSVDSAGNESSFSNEAVYVVPSMPATLASPAHAQGNFSFSLNGVAGQQYVIQASTNLVDWVSLQTNTAPFLFSDAHSAEFSQRFYRACAVAN